VLVECSQHRFAPFCPEPVGAGLLVQVSERGAYPLENSPDRVARTLAEFFNTMPA
jgi:hypothetical protein